MYEPEPPPLCPAGTHRYMPLEHDWIFNKNGDLIHHPTIMLRCCSECSWRETVIIKPGAFQ